MKTGSEWQGAVGDVWAREWRRTDRSFAELAPPLDAAIVAAAPDRPFRAADLGCGAGTTALSLASACPRAEVIGIDVSAALIAVAQERVIDGARFVLGDVLAMVPTIAPVDLYLSRHGVMFFADPVAAFATLAASAASGARLVFSCFAERRANRFAADLLDALGEDGEAPVGDAPGPFAFADPDRVAAILAAAGWRGAARRVDFAYRAGEGDDPVGDAAGLLARIGPAAAALRTASVEARPALRERIADACAARLRDGAVDFPAAAWIWTAERERERTP